MFKPLLALGLLAAVAMPVLAQDYPKVEIGLGYSYVHANVTAKDKMVTPSISATQSFDLHGGGGNIAYNPTRSIGLVADFAGYDVTGLPKGTGASATLFTYLFGPRYTYRGNERVQPFVHALFGGAHIGASVSTTVINDAVTPQAIITPVNAFGTSSNAFAMAIGGGLDVKLANHIALRLFEGDYLLTRFETTLNSSGKLEAANQNHFRFVTGLQFRF